ncbi:MAG: hypothetical protein IJ802_06915 [Kiritimatiellae bacterium]|nr:hypothetical protein [Kiritimatiellia bacterium]
MFRISVLALQAVLALACGAAFAQDGGNAAIHQPAMTRVKCATCGGKGSTVFAPPQRLAKLLGGGSIGTGRKYDVKTKCPVCNGRGSLLVRQTKDEPPRDCEPCSKCGWNGFEICKKCSGEGLVDCKEKHCDGGWIYTRREKGGNGQMVEPTLEPCRICGGVGKVVCKACRGERSLVCKKCHGTGEQPARKKK